MKTEVLVDINGSRYLGIRIIPESANEARMLAVLHGAEAWGEMFNPSSGAIQIIVPGAMTRKSVKKSTAPNVESSTSVSGGDKVAEPHWRTCRWGHSEGKHGDLYPWKCCVSKECDCVGFQPRPEGGSE